QWRGKSWQRILPPGAFVMLARQHRASIRPSSLKPSVPRIRGSPWDERAAPSLRSRFESIFVNASGPVGGRAEGRDSEVLMRTFTAVVERCPDTGLFVGYVPGLAGAHSQGEMLDELNRNLSEVIEMLWEDGEPG